MNNQTKNIALNVENLSCTFNCKDGKKVNALHSLNFHVNKGELVTLLGPSGCGKSTCFHIISGLLSPNEGKIFINNKDVTDTVGNVGYMFQKDLLLPWRVVLDNMILGAEVLGQNRKVAIQEARKLLVKLGLEGTEKFYPAQLSGGMRQRVAFGRTLLFHKDLLLLDEPLGALDSQTREYMQEWLQKVWKEVKTTILLVSHDVDEAIFLSDRIYVLTKQPGRVKAELKVDFPRPRSTGIKISSEYAKIRLKVYRLIHDE